ncbi:MAG: hypothetical protein OHM77_10165 [Candidatus Nitricoxidivorans perseverans]|uniref:DUF1311 domain-containing protein n=1 Tax=Candidatus Nitricoxidivorans perseverans TaxID=2975601 RepID=A0AA49FK63_9PROT|nr:MAG: hypothetical protein OHM77_10165 [Candidatus Nitricoxidivorans perseverans]
MKTLGLFFFVMFVYVGAVNSASYDCAKAETFVEKTICENAKLNRYDESMAHNYKIMSKAKDMIASDKKDLKASQMAWMKDRNKCTDSVCILNSYKSWLGDVCDAFPAVARATRAQCISVADVEAEFSQPATPVTQQPAKQADQPIANQQQPAAPQKSNERSITGAEKIDAAVLKNARKISEVGFSNSELKSRIYIGSENFITLEMVLGALFESESVKKITAVQSGKSKGFVMKARGGRAFGFLFKFDDGDALITHTVEDEDATRLKTTNEKLAAPMTLMMLVQAVLDTK